MCALLCTNEIVKDFCVINFWFRNMMGIVSHSQGLFIFISVSPTLPTNVPVIYLHVGLGQSEDLRKDFGDVKVLQLEPLVGT